MSALCNRLGAMALAASLLVGCANVPRQADFPHVSREVSQRTGLRVHWHQGTAEDEAVAAQVGAMLDQPLAPEHAVQVALLNNRRLQATYEDLMVAQADLVRAGLLRNPIFDAEIIFAQGGGTTVELSLVQDFMHVLQIPLRKKIAAARFEEAKARVTGEVLDTARNVHAAAVRYIAMTQLVEMRQTVAAAGEAGYQLTKRMHEAGNITDLTLALQRADYEQAKLDLATAQAEHVAMREQLNVLLGLWGGDSARWTMIARLPEPADEPDDRDAATLVRQALEQSLALTASRHRIESMSKRLGLERTFGLLPDFEAGAKAEHESDGDDWAIGPVFSLPIPLFDQGQAGTAAAGAELRRAQAEYYATAVEVRAATRASVARLRAAEARVNYFQQVILPLRQEIVDQTQLQYNAMQLGAFELLHARQQQVNAGTQYIESLRDYWLAHGSLRTLLMGGRGEIEQGSLSSNRQEAGANVNDRH